MIVLQIYIYGNFLLIGRDIMVFKEDAINKSIRTELYITLIVSSEFIEAINYHLISIYKVKNVIIAGY